MKLHGQTRSQADSGKQMPHDTRNCVGVLIFSGASEQVLAGNQVNRRFTGRPWSWISL